MLRVTTAVALLLALAACQQPMSAPPAATSSTAGIAAAPPSSQTGSQGYQGSPLIGQGQAIAPVNAGQTGSPLSHPGY